MEQDTFWAVIERIRAAPDPANALRAELGRLRPDDIAAFDRNLLERSQALDTDDLWGEAAKLLGAFGDPVFWDVRAWVVFQGQRFFGSVAADPSRLGDRPLSLEQVSAAGRLARMAPALYTECTGHEILEDFPEHPVPGEPLGQPA